MRSLRFPLLAGAMLSAAFMLSSAPIAFAETAAAPSSVVGAPLAAGNSLSDDRGAMVSTTSAEYFGTNQQSAAAQTNFLWWAVAVAGLAIIVLAWLGYRELA